MSSSRVEAEIWKGTGHDRDLDADNQSPLLGCRVVDFSVLMPGPMVAGTMATLGADVIKVEPPGGDPGRELYGGVFFRRSNKGKRSVALDLKDDHDRAIALELTASADVLVEGFRPGVADRLGIGFGSVRERNPNIIYCSIKGWGSSAPRASRPAHDINFLARSGLLAEPGCWSERHMRPTRPAIPFADLSSGATAVQAVLAALLGRERHGRGGLLEVPMQATVLNWMSFRVEPGAENFGEPSWLDPANDVHVTADGRRIAIGAVEPRHWRALCERLSEHADLPSEVADWSWTERRERGDWLSEQLARAFQTRPLQDWIELLEPLDLPVDPVLTAGEAYEDSWTNALAVSSDAPRLFPWAAADEKVPDLDEQGDALRPLLEQLTRRAR